MQKKILGTVLDVENPADVSLDMLEDVLTDILTDMAVGTTVASAIACYESVGKNNATDADRRATEAARDYLNRELLGKGIRGTIVIGEGERDEAPMLFINEKVGVNADANDIADANDAGAGVASGVNAGEVKMEIDIAIDPLECTTSCAKNLPNSITVVAMSPRGGLLNAPDVYMNKIATAINIPEGTLHINNDVEENIANLAGFLNIPQSSIGVCILNRPRHKELINKCEALGVKIHLIEDGDILGILQTAQYKTNGIHLYLGIGGAPEGVIAAAALKNLGGFIQGVLTATNASQEARLAKFNINDKDKTVLQIKDMAKGDCVFAATAVTDINMDILDALEGVEPHNIKLGKGGQAGAQKALNIGGVLLLGDNLNDENLVDDAKNAGTKAGTNVVASASAGQKYITNTIVINSRFKVAKLRRALRHI